VIRVLLAEDHTIVRKGLRSLLEQEPGIQVVAEALDGKEAVLKAREFRPDIVLMDIGMPGLNGIEATRRIKQSCPSIGVLVLTMHTSEEYIFEIIRAGASGYVIKDTAPTELVAAMRAVYRGDSYLSPAVSKQVLDGYVRRAEHGQQGDAFGSLTTREREVLQLIAEGHTNRAIAERLFISVKTVETHRAHLMEKLDIHSTAGLTKYALRRGLTLFE
jgi:two-component system response regulator NreC